MPTHTPYHHLANPHPQQLQITPEEYRAAREELRSIDARPIKKVAEAKARKQKRLRMRLDKVGARGWGSRRAEVVSRRGIAAHRRWALVVASAQWRMLEL